MVWKALLVTRLQNQDYVWNICGKTFQFNKDYGRHMSDEICTHSTKAQTIKKKGGNVCVCVGGGGGNNEKKKSSCKN